jgi:hypothetical protein
MRESRSAKGRWLRVIAVMSLILVTVIIVCLIASGGNVT